MRRRSAASWRCTRPPYGNTRPQDPTPSGHPGETVLDTAYLVDDRHGVAFVTAAEALGLRTPGVGVEVTGPWPAYSFVSLAGSA